MSFQRTSPVDAEEITLPVSFEHKNVTALYRSLVLPVGLFWDTS